jgi:hypothetical protein
MFHVKHSGWEGASWGKVAPRGTLGCGSAIHVSTAISAIATSIRGVFNVKHLTRCGMG